jgi:hypothetical protein
LEVEILFFELGFCYYFTLVKTRHNFKIAIGIYLALILLMRNPLKILHLTKKEYKMKKILKLCAIVLLFQSFQCEDNAIPVEQSFDLVSLQQERQNILDYIATFTCDENATCNMIAFGSKACGGPQKYLVFSSTVDLAYLREQVTNYNALEKAYNLTYGIFSNCMAVLPPENIGCADGVCTILP